jgi:hypothetical protein
MSYKDITEIENLGYAVTQSFECAAPIHAMLFNNAIVRTAGMMSVQARRSVPELRELGSVTDMKDDEKRGVLSRYFIAIADRFADFCDPQKNEVLPSFSAEDRQKFFSIHTREVAESFRIHMETASELVLAKVPYKDLPNEAQRASVPKIIDAAFPMPGVPSDNRKKADRRPGM